MCRCVYAVRLRYVCTSYFPTSPQTHPYPAVPRPLFIEEFGLRLLLEQEGTGVELSRSSYESGEWAAAIDEAWHAGKARKAAKRKQGETGKRKEEGRKMAQEIVEWVGRWKEAVV